MHQRQLEDRIRYDWAADKIREASDGRLDIAVFYAGEVISTKETFDAVATGIVELCGTISGYHTGFMPEMDCVKGLPGGYRSPADCQNVLWGLDWLLFDKVREAYKDFNHYLVAPSGQGSRQDVLLTKPITRLDDLKEFKLRSYGILSDYIAKTGAAMTYIPGEEIYTALAMGTVDGTTWSGWSGFYTMKFHEVAKYYLENYFGGMTGSVNANLDAWNELPDDLKNMLEHYFFKAGSWYAWLSVLQDAMYRDEMMADWGVQIIDLPKEDRDRWTAMGNDLWEEVAAKSPRAREWVDLLKEWMKWRGYL